MADYCPNCFEVLDALHICGDSSTSKSTIDSGSAVWRTNQSLASFVIFAPLAGVILDLIMPFPSSLIHSLFISILGSAFAGAFWVAVKYQGQKSFKFFAVNLKNFIFTPNMIKVFGSLEKNKTTASWVAMIFASAALQIILFTPGNSMYLENQVSTKIDDASGANLSVDCPGLRFYFYNDNIECRVKTGILGITVPARSQLSPLVGSADIKVSLL